MRGHREIRGPVLEQLGRALKSAWLEARCVDPNIASVDPIEVSITVPIELFEMCVREASLNDRIVRDYDTNTTEILFNIERDHLRLTVRCDTPRRQRG